MSAEATEVWRPIPAECLAYPLYEASSLGRIRHAETGRIVPQHPARYCEKHRATFTKDQEEMYYMKLALSGPPRVTKTGRVSTQYMARVNRLVCLAFHGLPPHPKCHAHHKDEDKLNNVPENLEWRDHLAHHREHMNERHRRRRETEQRRLPPPRAA